MLLYRFCFPWCCCPLFLLWRIAKASSIIALVLAIPAIAGRWINHFRPDLVPPPVFLVAGLALIAFVVANLLRFVLRAPSVNTEVLCASISAYLMLGLLWTIAYWLVAQVTPNAFAFNTAAGQNRPWQVSTLSTSASSH